MKRRSRNACHTSECRSPVGRPRAPEADDAEPSFDNDDPRSARGSRRASARPTATKKPAPAAATVANPHPSSSAPSSGPTTAPSSPVTASQANSETRRRPASSRARCAAPRSTLSPGENSAPPKPVSAVPRTKAQIAGHAGHSAADSVRKPAARTAQPIRMIARGPNRSASAPPTTNSPCCENVRTPSTSPTAAAPSPKSLVSTIAMNGTTA